MNVADTTGTAQVRADEAAVAEHLLTGKPLAPEIYRRVRARAEQVTAQLRQRHGEMGLAVDLIRGIRDE
jgi:hypothetical protein